MPTFQNPINTCNSAYLKTEAPTIAPAARPISGRAHQKEAEWGQAAWRRLTQRLPATAPLISQARATS